MSERGQVAPVLAGITLLLLWGGLFLFFLGRVDAGGARAQTAADLAALAAAQRLAADPAAGAPALRAEAARVARANGGRLVSLVTLTDHGLPSGVEVGVAVRVEGAVPGVGRQAHDLVQRSRAAVSFSASLPAGTFRPIDLHGLTGRSAVVAAAAAQIGWPYIWGGESRAEGGFDCSGLIDFAYAAAGHALPGRPTAAGLWRMARPVSPDELLPGDLVFRGAESRAPYHVGMYAGQGAVIVAPHSGAQVRFEPVAAGGWDGFGRLLEGPAAAAGDPAVDAAARRNGVPPFVVQAEMRLGLAGDPEAAAAALARAQARHPDDLESALVEALGSRSAAALVLREGAGTELGEGFQGHARLVPVPSDGDSNGTAGAAPAGASPERSGRVGRGDLVASAVRVAEIAAHQLAGHGSRARLQALAGLRNASRFALTGAALLLPDPGWREAASFAGSAWDAASAASQALETWGTAGVVLGRWGLLAARLNVLGGAVSTILFAGMALHARSRRDRVGYGLMAAGAGIATAGTLSIGAPLVPMLAAGAVAVPPLGLALMAAGATICAAGYAYRHPEVVRRVLGACGRALDIAWRIETAPARAAVSVATRAAGAARAVASAIPAPW